MDTFARALEHIRYYVRAGTQTELSLTGIGEAILHPLFEEMVARCREVIGDERQLVLSTNGVAIEPKHARILAHYRVQTYVSLHRPEVAAPAARMLHENGVEVLVNHAFVDSAINWAGQVDWHSTAPRYTCDYLARGWAVIRANGSVDACCQDAHDLHPIGHVNDEVGSLHTHAIALCANCHLMVPKTMRGIAA